MKFISFIFLMLVVFSIGKAQSPHGDQLKFDCSKCHIDQGWEIDVAKSKFDHSKTQFELEGEHAKTDCQACHSSLVFSEVKSKCVDCHTDMHQQTLGLECENCHTPNTWIIENTQNIHRNSQFPLFGVHSITDCALCHKSIAELKFEPLSVDCYSCHQESFLATTEPNHIQEGYSTNCAECHNDRSFEWTATGVNHDFFPLRGGHAQINCADCHGVGKYEKVSAECVDCHLTDYNEAENHIESGFSTNCTECHNTEPSWQLSSYKNHDSEYFPVYSGRHRNAWNSCLECHTEYGTYKSFSCVDCHEHRKGLMDRHHGDVSDYIYNSNECFSCHPRGNKE